MILLPHEIRRRSAPLPLLSLLLLFLLLLSTTASSSPIFNFQHFSSSKPLCFAHRGLSGYYPQNTLLAFQKALEFGADGIELDVRMTSDNVLIVFHDTEFNELTNGTGLTTDRPYHGYVESLIVKSSRGFTESIPTLKQALNLLTRRHDVNVSKVIIDVKSDNPISIMKLLAKDLEGFVSSSHGGSGRNGSMHQIFVAVWDERFLLHAQHYLPQFRQSFTSGHIDDAKSLRRKVDTYNMDFNQEFIDNNGEFIRFANAMKRPVFVWTVDDEASIKRALGMGVQGLLTNFVDKCLEARDIIGKWRDKNIFG